jgi:hypothetical protein
MRGIPAAIGDAIGTMTSVRSSVTRYFGNALSISVNPSVIILRMTLNLGFLLQKLDC